LAALMRNVKTAIRHGKWLRLYHDTYKSETNKNIANGMAIKTARFQARLQAQAKVAKTFDVSARQVRKVVITYERIQDLLDKTKIAPGAL
jgi:hypothetical protein